MHRFGIVSQNVETGVSHIIEANFQLESEASGNGHMTICMVFPTFFPQKFCEHSANFQNQKYHICGIFFVS